MIVDSCIGAVEIRFREKDRCKEVDLSILGSASLSTCKEVDPSILGSASLSRLYLIEKESSLALLTVTVLLLILVSQFFETRVTLVSMRNLLNAEIGSRFTVGIK